MWPNQFEYQRANSVDEVVSILANDGDAKVLAGGHSLLPAMKLRLSEPGTLVDIGRIDRLSFINSSDGNLNIGAMTTHAEIAASSEVQAHCPALAQACGMVGDQQVRNFGTIGGNIAHADPASDPPTVLLACNATIHIQNTSGSRSVSAGDFFIDLFTTALEPGDLITGVSIPSTSGKSSAYAKMLHPASRYAIVGVCVVLEMNGSTCSNASVAVGGAVASVVRSSGAESALAGSSLDSTALDNAANALMGELGDNLIGDINYPEEYRRAMAGVYLKRAVRAALG